MKSPICELALFLDENLAAPLLYIPASYWAQSRCAHRLAAAQIETGVVPRTSDGASRHHTVCERAMIMAAMGADRERLGATMDKEHLFVFDASYEPAVDKLTKRHA
jgi:hypothetical protein